MVMEESRSRSSMDECLLALSDMVPNDDLESILPFLEDDNNDPQEVNNVDDFFNEVDKLLQALPPKKDLGHGVRPGKQLPDLLMALSGSPFRKAAKPVVVCSNSSTLPCCEQMQTATTRKLQESNHNRQLCSKNNPRQLMTSSVTTTTTPPTPTDDHQKGVMRNASDPKSVPAGCERALLSSCSLAEKLERSKRKLQEGYEQCKKERKRTCLMTNVAHLPAIPPDYPRRGRATLHRNHPNNQFPRIQKNGVNNHRKNNLVQSRLMPVCGF